MTVKQRLILDIQYEFNRIYPYLKIEFTRSRGEQQSRQQQDETTRQAAKNLLWKELRLSDNMKVSEL